ncbi:hypothetical protein GDO78_008764 [Eleutherodactylus coqui]|uniref:Uncharacterized protein n=1 Tax=Eleutherodactylus coqui TaxID=57060 RepID=A0A8J6FCP9_ELECQ|nr:hypothetical protein GDO78_008764 [Eleutherodactylus coqui]
MSPDILYSSDHQSYQITIIQGPIPVNSQAEYVVGALLLQGLQVMSVVWQDTESQSPGGPCQQGGQKEVDHLLTGLLSMSRHAQNTKLCLRYVTCSPPHKQ